MVEGNIFQSIKYPWCCDLNLKFTTKVEANKGSEVGMCATIQTHSHKCVKMQENEFQYSQMDFHFESWEVHLMSQNFGTNVCGI